MAYERSKNAGVLLLAVVCVVHAGCATGRRETRTPFGSPDAGELSSDAGVTGLDASAESDAGLAADAGGLDDAASGDAGVDAARADVGPMCVPEPEVCDGVSNDCDAEVDEGAICVLPNADATCSAGSCVIAACVTGYADCDAAMPGCETDTRSDAMHCGRCDMACPTGSVCSGGACSGSTGGVVPGSTGAASRDGWEVRCLAWSGDLCTRPQARIRCATCAIYPACDMWHDVTPFNTASTRAAPSWCYLATGSNAVTRTAMGGTAATPRGCGWNSSTHPLCEAARATFAYMPVGLTGGLLLNDSYCAASGELLHIECAGW